MKDMILTFTKEQFLFFMICIFGLIILKDMIWIHISMKLTRKCKPCSNADCPRYYECSMTDLSKLQLDKLERNKYE